MIARTRLVVAAALVLVVPMWVGPVRADDGDGAEADGDAVTAEAAETPATSDPGETEPVAFGDDLAAAQEEARSSGRPLLVVAVPDWYESPMWRRVEKDVLAKVEVARPLTDFVRVRVAETRDREVHVRHRLPFAGYPLAVVLSAEGTYLGHESGLPGDGDVTAWPRRLAAIPARAAKVAALRKRLDVDPEDALVLFELGRLLADAGESDRADALFVRMERADPLAPAERLGEARYLQLRHAVVDLMEKMSFGDVEGRCLRWRRRFATHERLADVLLLQANARFLSNRHDDAKELWEVLVKDHADTSAGKSAKKALAGL